ncbi:MAG: DNA-directed DNA polymerase II small subunit [Candidatus Micrarchaeia archaeon]
MPGEESIKRLAQTDRLVTTEAVRLLESLEDPGYVVEQILQEKSIPIVTVELIQEIVRRREEKKIPLPVEVVRSSDFTPTAKEFEPELRFFPDKEVTGKSRCTGSLDDFVLYFRDRYQRLRNILLSHHSKLPTAEISSLRKSARGSEVRVIGLVADKKVTKNGHILLELESEDDTVKVLALKGERYRDVFATASSVLLDDVIAVEGRLSEAFLIASYISWPDVPPREARRAERELCVAFISDTHVGSRNFLEGPFKRMLSWLNGNCPPAERELAGKVKYLFVAGDLVDGVGVYPGQENELAILDIHEQYKAFCELMAQVPDYIEIVVIPGNHDAVRRAEPQPALSAELISEHAPANMHLLGNPSQLEVEGLRALLYHGTSLDSIIAAVPNMSYERPEKAMVELLKRRNLSPIYSENPIVPEHRDYMLIDEVPDLVHMGHLHKNGAERYRGTFLLNAGTWQARTAFQIRLGHIPTPCFLPIYNLHTLKLDVINFAEAQHG